MPPFIKTGIPALINKAKQEYRKEYKRKWKQERKQKVKAVSVEFHTVEYKQIQIEAKIHSIKVASFVKKGVQAYMNKTYINPTEEKVNRIHMLLKMMIIHIEDLIEDDKPLGSYLLALQQLEHDIRVYLNSPPELYNYLARHLTKNPNYKEELLRLIETV